MDYYGYCKAHTEQSEPKDLQTQQRYQVLNVNNNIALVPCITENISLFSSALSLVPAFIANE